MSAADCDYSHFNNKLTITDFDLLKVLGKGAFGRVMLVKKKNDPSNILYAMKTLRIAALVKRNQLAHTTTERYILQNITSPFLVHLQFAFRTPEKLYMVMDYMAGGELFFWLKKDKIFSEGRCRLYAAEITVALEALHTVCNLLYCCYCYCCCYCCCCCFCFCFCFCCNIFVILLLLLLLLLM